MDRLRRALTGRHYRLFRYDGPSGGRARRRRMGSGGEVLRETAPCLNGKGEKVGVLQVLLYRPFSAEHFLAALPASGEERSRCSTGRKEPGAHGEPLYLDVLATLAQAVGAGKRARDAARDRRALRPVVEGLRSGAWPRRSSTSSTKPTPKNGFTVGIDDDVSHTSLDVRSAIRHRAGRRRARAVLRPRRRRHGWRQQELREDPRRRSPAAMRRATSSTIRRSPARDDLASALRHDADPRALPASSQPTSSACHKFDFLFEHGRARRGARRGATVPAQQPLRAGRGVGRSCRGRCRSRSSTRSSGSSSSTPPRSRSTWASARASTPSCRPASSRSPACCRATRRSPRSRRRPRRPTPARAARSCEKNFAAIDAALAHLHEVTVPDAADRRASRRRWCRTTRRPSCATSPP